MFSTRAAATRRFARPYGHPSLISARPGDDQHGRRDARRAQRLAQHDHRDQCPEQHRVSRSAATIAIGATVIAQIAIQ